MGALLWTRLWCGAEILSDTAREGRRASGLNSRGCLVNADSHIVPVLVPEMSSRMGLAFSHGAVVSPLIERAAEMELLQHALDDALQALRIEPTEAMKVDA